MKKIWLAIAAAVIVLGLAYGAYAYVQLSRQNRALQSNVSALREDVNALTQALSSSSVQLSSTTQSLIATSDELSSTTQSLTTAQNQNGSFESEINQLSGSVQTLQTLANTDPQLLEKYSKVYFLSDNYAPASLSPVNPQYLYTTSTPQLFLSGVLPDLDALLAAANRDGIPLKVISAYRSFAEQGILKLDYTDTYGNGANSFSADQGYSEHQLGTAVDFGMPGAKNLQTKFASSTGYAWLTANAYQYGFILSYPPGNIYYQFEPWHWRYVGVKLATFLHDNDEYFYNMAQRDIDQYLVSFFN